jgi:lipopolysaccharide/colanic/teichoic acid biosynthesis glycosyltransferase/cellulose synthase/poly-beta-1,6-N-acetylglucosamine synthase-like glycosyltransferase
MLDFFLMAIVAVSLVAFVYHHFIFPGWLNRLAKASRDDAEASPLSVSDDEMPTMTIVVAAYNEENFIADKIRNLSSLIYPNQKLSVVIACDGCTDETASRIRATLNEPECRHLQVEIKEYSVNRGKVAVLNKAQAEVTTDLVCLSDVSAWMSVDALRQAVSNFGKADVGVVAATYRLTEAGSDGEQVYWAYQTRIKQGEAALGAPLGVHGACYFMRRECFQKLPADTINDDFVLPMQAIADGWLAVYDSSIVGLETEPSDIDMDFARRCRIGAGNMQQVIRLRSLLHPKHRGIAAAFASGKLLRTLTPFLLLACFVSSTVLAVDHVLFSYFFAAQCAGYGVVLMRHFYARNSRFKVLELLYYLIAGHAANLIGSAQYLLGLRHGPWGKVGDAAAETDVQASPDYSPTAILWAKRAMDIAGALAAAILALPVIPLLILVIRLDSPGPVFFRQHRIGRCEKDRTQLFWMYKFRTMRIDAEAAGRPVWATKNDPRVTRIGRILRKTRLDEIPQLWNVLRGDMSLIGPRPERPGFYEKLEKEIPFFVERTAGLRPGITGLAQVKQGYDRDLEDVRSKVCYDHAYALSLSGFFSWLSMDLRIVGQTVWIMAAGRGQ